MDVVLETSLDFVVFFCDHRLTFPIFSVALEVLLESHGLLSFVDLMI
jgi:hypothetical protein